MRTLKTSMPKQAQELSQKVKFSNGLKKYFFNTNWMFLEHIIKIISGVFVGAYVARYLGVESFGLFSYVLACFVIFESIGKSGIENIFIKHYIDKDQSEEVLRSYLFYRLLTGLLVFALLLSYSFFASDKAISYGLKILSFVFLFQPLEIFEHVFQPELK